jgi:GAF domain-containing protein
MNLHNRARANASWFLDSASVITQSEMRELAQAVCQEPDPFTALSLRRTILQLPNSDATLSALQAFGERCEEISYHLECSSEQHTSRLFSFSQAVTSALSQHLRDLGLGSNGTQTAELQTRVGHLSTIQQVNSVANSTLDLKKVLDLTVRSVSEVLEIDDCSIYLFDERTNRLTLSAATGHDASAVDHLSLKLGEGIIGWTAQQGEPVALENANEDPRFLYFPVLGGENLQSLLSVPIIQYSVNRLVGVLNVQSKDFRRYSGEEISFVETICGQIAIAIDNARLYEQTDEELREKVSQLTTLQRVGASIASSLDLREVLETIARHAAELSNAEKAAIFKLDEASHDLLVVAGYNISDHYRTMRVKVGEGAVGKSVANRTPIQVQDAYNDPHLASVYPQIVSEGIRSMFCVPLIARNRVLGGIGVFTLEQREFSEEQVQLISTFAFDAALAIENARLYQEAQRSLETQAVLMREMQHRVKNNLQTIASLLSLQKRRAKTVEAASLLSLSAARVESIAAVHELLTEEDIGLATIEEIAGRIKEIAVNDLVPSSQEIEFTVAPAPIRLESKQATLFALALNELVSNAVTHGLAGGPTGGTHSIHLKAVEENGLIAVEIWDSGKGLPEGFTLSKHAGLGLSIVEQLVTHELSGSFVLANGPTGCATATITFPAEESDFWTVWWKD